MTEEDFTLVKKGFQVLDMRMGQMQMLLQTIHATLVAIHEELSTRSKSAERN